MQTRKQEGGQCTWLLFGKEIDPGCVLCLVFGLLHSQKHRVFLIIRDLLEIGASETSVGLYLGMVLCAVLVACSNRLIVSCFPQHRPS